MASVETNLSKYQVPEDTAKQFDAISNFAKNMVIKDSKFYDSINEGCETELSSAFGKLLIKYYESELSDNDILQLLNLIVSYNKTISEAIEVNYLNKNKNFYKFGDFEKNKNTKEKTILVNPAISRFR